MEFVVSCALAALSLAGLKTQREEAMIDNDVVLGKDTTIYMPELSNLYGCQIGNGCEIGPFVEIQRGAVIGDGCKVCSHAFIAGGVELGKQVFVGHGVVFCNDNWPLLGGPRTVLRAVEVGDSASIGSGAVILPDVVIGYGAVVGAGAVVTEDIPALSVVVGNPARVVRLFETLQDRDAWAERSNRIYNNYA